MIIPNRSFLFFAKSTLTRFHEWGVSPAYFCNNSSGYSYVRNKNPALFPIQGQRYFCKESIHGNKLWVNSPEALYDQNGLLHPFSSVVIYFENESGVKYTLSSISDSPHMDESYVIASPVLNKSMLRVLIHYATKNPEYNSGYFLKKIALAFDKGESDSLIECLKQGVDYNNIYAPMEGDEYLIHNVSSVYIDEGQATNTLTIELDNIDTNITPGDFFLNTGAPEARYSKSDIILYL